jgi:hypothetical protein
MSEKTQTPPNQEEESKKPNYFMRRAAVATGLTFTVGAAGYGVGKAIEAGVEHFDKKPVAELVVQLDQNEDMLTLVEKWAPTLADQAGIDPAAIPSSEKYDEAIQAGQEMYDLTGDISRQAGEQYVLELTKNDAGQYGIEVSPFVPPRLDSGLPPLDEDPVS